MADEHLERATAALVNELADQQFTTPPPREADPEFWENARRCAVACIEAWDHGGATLAGDFPIDASSIDIVTNEDGSLTVRRKPIAWRPLHEGYGPDHS